MGPHFRLEAVPKMKTEKFSRKNHQFRIHETDDWFCGPKTFVFGSQNCSIRDGLTVYSLVTKPCLVETASFFCGRIWGSSPARADLRQLLRDRSPLNVASSHTHTHETFSMYHTGYGRMRFFNCSSDCIILFLAQNQFFRLKNPFFGWNVVVVLTRGLCLRKRRGYYYERMRVFLFQFWPRRRTRDSPFEVAVFTPDRPRQQKKRHPPLRKKRCRPPL